MGLLGPILLMSEELCFMSKTSTDLVLTLIAANWLINKFKLPLDAIHGHIMPCFD